MDLTGYRCNRRRSTSKLSMRACHLYVWLPGADCASIGAMHEPEDPSNRAPYEHTVTVVLHTGMHRFKLPAQWRRLARTCATEAERTVVVAGAPASGTSEFTPSQPRCAREPAGPVALSGPQWHPLAGLVTEQELYGAHGVEPCVSGPRSPRLPVGASYDQLQETIEDEMADVSTVLAFWSNSDLLW